MPITYETHPEATWLIVGDAPGVLEEKAGRLYVGAVGQFVEGVLTMVGLKRGQANVVSVLDSAPESSKKLKNLFPKGEPNPDVQAGQERLKQFIAETKPKAILVFGNLSLWALTGLQNVSARRGSVYYYEGIPVVPAMNPASVMHVPSELNLFVRDVHKFMRVLRGDDVRPLKRRLVLHPNIEDLAELRACMMRGDLTSVDIETGNRQLQCVGFAPRPDFAVVLHPGAGPGWKEMAASLLSTPCPKVFHNAPYDIPYLEYREGITVAGPIHDTLAMAQALHPEMPRDLGTLVSLYTNEPYFKDLNTLWHKVQDYDMYWRYNALDCATTRELAEVLLKKLDDAGLDEVYERTRAVLPHAMAMSVRGIKYDTVRAGASKDKLQRYIDRWQRILDGRAGKPINVNSPADSRWFLYEKLGLPKKYLKEADDPTTSQRVLLSLYPLITDRHARQGLRALLAVRNGRKLHSSYFAIQPSADGRMRTSFNPAGTETGRWTAGKFLISEGVNLQTVPGPWKECFVADEGYVLWNADYSQIEARLVAYLAQDSRSIAIFEDPNGDIHKENASEIFKKPVSEITKRERDIGKTVHALNYGVGPETLMQTVNKRALDTGVWLDRKMAELVRTTYLHRFDNVVAWQHETWMEVKRKKMLTNPFGRRRIFLGPTTGAASNHTKGEALAFVPQSTVPDMMNTALIALRTNPPVPGFEVLNNVHDALFGQAPADSIDQWAPAIKKAMEIPLTIHGRTFTVPVDIKVGPRWSTMKLVKV